MKLQEYLDKMGISQRQFSKKIGVSHTTIKNICQDKRPSKENARRIERETKQLVLADEMLELEKRKPYIIYR